MIEKTTFDRPKTLIHSFAGESREITWTRSYGRKTQYANNCHTESATGEDKLRRKYRGTADVIHGEIENVTNISRK